MLPKSNQLNAKSLPLFNNYSKHSTRDRVRRLWRLLVIAVIIICVMMWKSTSSTTHTTYSNKHEVQLNKPAAPDLAHFKELDIARNTRLQPLGGKIPNIVHFVYGLRDPDPTLEIIHYIAIKSAHDILKPDKIIFHYHHLPVGKNFERALPMLTLNRVEMVDEIFGRPVNHYAHKADIVRLQALLEYGGIYLDLDLVTLKSVNHLLDKEFVMAQEGIDGAVGLCNAMIMARPQARFLQRWYSTYKTFNGNDWNFHSVILPNKLASFFNNEITVLNHTSFFWPLWDSVGLRTMYLEKSYDYDSNIGTHLWESAANKNLMKDVSEDVIMEIDNSAYCQLRRFLLNDQQDPRPNACTIIKRTDREDRMVGHWPLLQGLNMTDINPLPARDNSGNQLNGQIRNGRYEEEGVYLSGDGSYIFLPLPTAQTMDSFTVSWWMRVPKIEPGKIAMAIQTENGRVCVQTHQQSESLSVKTIGRNDAWEWEDMDEITSPYEIDDMYHHYTLVINTKHTSNPSLLLMMDGHIISSSSHWNYPARLGKRIEGVWLGSIQPFSDRYEDPWDTTYDMEAVYRDISIWDYTLSIDNILQIYSSSDRRPKETKKIMIKPTQEPLDEDEDVREEEDDDLQWEDDQLED